MYINPNKQLHIQRVFFKDGRIIEDVTCQVLDRFLIILESDIFSWYNIEVIDHLENVSLQRE